MDLEAIHALAPDAKKVLVNARSTVEGDGSYEKIATMMEDAERRYPGPSGASPSAGAATS